MRSFGACRLWAERWRESRFYGVDRSKLMQFMSQEYPPVFEFVDNEVLIMDIFAPPQLHLFTGITHHLYKNLMRKLEAFDEKLYKKIDNWMKQNKIIPSEKTEHGFTGGCADKLLSKSQNEN